MPWKAGVHPARRDARRVRGKSIPTRIGSHCDPSTQLGPPPDRSTSVHDGGSLSPPREGIFFGSEQASGPKTVGAHPVRDAFSGDPRWPAVLRCREPNRPRPVYACDWPVPLPWNLTARLPTLPSDGRAGNANQLVFSHVIRLTFIPAQPLSAPGFLWAKAGRRHEPVGPNCSAPRPARRGRPGGAQPMARRIASISLR